MTLQQPTQEEKEFASAPLGKLILKYALPTVISMLFLGAITVVDAYFVGNYIGADALAGVNIVTPLYTATIAISLVISLGLVTLIGKGLGSKNYQLAHDAAHTAIITLALFTVTLSAGLYLFSREMVLLCGADDILGPYSETYFRWLVPFFPLLSLSILCDFTLKAVGKPYLAMGIMIGMVVINIVLDYFFIVSLSWGLRGAALASGLSLSIGALVVIPMLFSKQLPIRIKEGRFDKTLLSRMCYNGSSEGINDLSVALSLFLFNLVLMRNMGAEGVAAFTAINYLQYICVTVMLGVSDGMVPIISYNHGASNLIRVKKLLNYALCIISVIGLLLFLVVQLYARELISIFFDTHTVSTSLLEMATSGAQIWAIAFLFNGANILISAYNTAIHKAGRSAAIALMRGALFVTVGVLVYPLLFGIDAVWYAVPIAEIATLLVILATRNNKNLIHGDE